VRARRCGVVLAGLIAVLGAWPAAGAGKSVQGVVNLNTAPADVLGLLPGIGPAKAESIVAYRKRRPFRTVDELVRIKGIGRKMVRRLRAHLAVSGPTTAGPGVAADVGARGAVPPPPTSAPARPPARPALALSRNLAPAGARSALHRAHPRQPLGTLLLPRGACLPPP
jgi:competence protein ComEA